MRKRIYEIIEVSQENDRVSFAYDLIMLIAIILSVLPLAFKTHYSFFTVIDIVTTVLFIIDYLLRLVTADYKLNDKRAMAFIIYPFTPLALIDFLSILPALLTVSSSLKLLRLVRIFRTFRVFRVFKMLRYSKSIMIISTVIKKSKDALIAVSTFAVGYILISALVIFNVEGDTFPTFFEAVYWATVSLTTVGYGDVYPVTTAGRIITMISSMCGIAIIALPSGIITAGYMETLSEENKQEQEK